MGFGLSQASRLGHNGVSMGVVSVVALVVSGTLG